MRLPDYQERINAFYRGEGGKKMTETVYLLWDRRTVTIDGLVIIDESLTPGEKLAATQRTVTQRFWGAMKPGDDRWNACFFC